MIREQLVGLSYADKCNFKATEIAKISGITRTKIGNTDIEVLGVTKIDKGVEVLARAWQNGKQIGFGRDGTVDIERFRIINPPVLVPSPTGTITLEDYDSYRKEYSQRKVIEDTSLALLHVLNDTIRSKKQKSDDTRIISGKVGSTTSTIYPTDDGMAYYNGNTSNWSTMVAGAGDTLADTGTLDGRLYYFYRSGNWRHLGRGLLIFDTSGIGSDTIDSATLDVYVFQKTDPNSDTPNTDLYGLTPATAGSLAATDFANCGSTSYTGSALSYSGITASAYNTFTLNATGEAAIDGSGYSNFSFRNANYDVANTSPTASNVDAYASFYTVEQTGTTNDPYLTVEHTGNRRIFIIS